MLQAGARGRAPAHRTANPEQSEAMMMLSSLAALALGAAPVQA
jgi:hypothetical protein